MEVRQTAERSARFIGIIERLEEGWRVCFRLRLPGEVFTQQGDTVFFASELQATKWLHTQANARGFSSIEIRHRAPSRRAGVRLEG
jgi:hypothetical protein